MTFKQLLHHLNLRSTRLFPQKLTIIKVILIIISITTVTFSVKAILAQENPNLSQNYIKKKQDAIEKGNNQEAWIDSALGSNLMSTQIMLSGTIPDSVLSGETTPNGYPVSYTPQGLIGTSNQIIASMFTPSASGIEYIAQVKENFLGKPAYAATGFEGLKNILNLWKASRNIVYILISIFFIVLGLMIMLRIKTSPQTVVTIQSSMPKVITTLVLVTFSYAIAGLCIDIMNLFYYLGLSLLFKGTNISQSENLIPLAWGDWSIMGLINLIRNLFNDKPYAFDALTKMDFWGVWALIQRLAPSLSIMALGAVVGAVIGGVTTGGVATLGGAAIGAVAISVIVSIIIVFYLFKIIFKLAKCYISILLKIIFGPFELFLGAFPNSKVGFSTWILGIISNLAVFPVTVFFLLIANILMNNISGGLWAPLLIGGPVVFFLPVVIGLSSIAMLSKIPELVPQAISQAKPSSFGKGIGESFIPLGKVAKPLAREGVGKGLEKIDNKYGAQASVGSDGDPKSAKLWHKAITNTKKTYDLFSKRKS